MWRQLEVIFARSESQKPTRTSPLVSIPRQPIKTRAALYGTKELEVEVVHSDDVVIASVVNLSVWNAEDISPEQSTVHRSFNSSISEESVAFSSSVSEGWPRFVAQILWGVVQCLRASDWMLCCCICICISKLS